MILLLLFFTTAVYQQSSRSCAFIPCKSAIQKKPYSESVKRISDVTVKELDRPGKGASRLLI